MDTLYNQRIQTIRNQFDEWQIDAMLITRMVNCRWLSGFTGSAGSILISADRALLATDSRYWEQAEEQAPAFGIVRHMRRPQDTVAFIQLAAASNIGLEANEVTLQQGDELTKIDGITWRHLDRPIEPLRSIKTESEISAVRAAAKITDAAMAMLPQLVHPGITEAQLAWELEKQMRESGANGMAFDPIVAFGAHAARPHHAPGNRELKVGELVLVDMGAMLNGYCSDLTRTFFYGESPDPQFEEIFNLVHTAQTNAIDQLAPGIDSQTAHKFASDTIEAGGYGDYFGHGLGHGLGLEIHEEPFLSATRAPQLLAEGMTLTIEPGIYIPDWGGIRIEDLILITKSGTEYISKMPKNMILSS